MVVDHVFLANAPSRPSPVLILHPGPLCSVQSCYLLVSITVLSLFDNPNKGAATNLPVLGRNITGGRASGDDHLQGQGIVSSSDRARQLETIHVHGAGRTGRLGRPRPEQPRRAYPLLESRFG